MPKKNNIKISNDDLIKYAKNGNIKVVKFLLDKGADINAQTNNDWTALIWAARNGHTETVATLLDKGA